MDICRSHWSYYRDLEISLYPSSLHSYTSQRTCCWILFNSSIKKHMWICLASGFQPPTSSLWIQCDQRNDSRTFLGGERVYYPACSHGGRSSTSVSNSIQSTGPSSIYSEIIAYCLKVQPSNRPSYIIRWCKFSEDPGHRNPNFPQDHITDLLFKLLVFL